MFFAVATEIRDIKKAMSMNILVMILASTKLVPTAIDTLELLIEVGIDAALDTEGIIDLAANR